MATDKETIWEGIATIHLYPVFILFWFDSWSSNAHNAKLDVWTWSIEEVITVDLKTTPLPQKQGVKQQWLILLTWFNFNSDMDKQSHAWLSVGWNYLSIPHS